MQTLWLCPQCRDGLELAAGVWTCRSGHAFDQAREGYVNLTGGRQKAGIKGDSPEMLAARSRFFEGGHYEPLRARLIQLVAKLEHRRVAEIGCGQGYYIGGISEHLSGSKSLCLGTDIAKEGVRRAARAYPAARFAVADTNVLVPLPDATVDVVLNIFAPRNSAEFGRVLRPAGRLVVVIPTARHLGELRALVPLLAVQADKRRAVEAGLEPLFRLVAAERLALTLRLNGAAIQDLVAMTPNAWFVPATHQARLAETAQMAVTAEFEVLQFSPI